MWNVKTLGTLTVTSAAGTVLIETLWNVKIFPWILPLCTVLVLIETLWNVKVARKFRLIKGGKCINRNIVECKVDYGNGMISVTYPY